MIYLKNFNESESNRYELLNSVNTCFSELIDDGHANVEDTEDGEEIVYVSVYFSEPPETQSFFEYAEYQNNRNDIINDVKVALLRLNDIHSNLSVNLSLEDEDSISLTIINGVETGSFYKIKDNLVVLDINKIKSILKIENANVSMHGYNKPYLKICLTKQLFMEYMYRGDESARYKNENVEDALIIFPELGKVYHKLGKLFDNLKIKEDDLCILFYIVHVRGTGSSARNRRGEEYTINILLNEKYKYQT